MCHIGVTTGQGRRADGCCFACSRPCRVPGVTGRPTLVEVSRAGLTGPAWDHRIRRGGGAKASQVALHLGARLIVATWPVHAGSPPRPRDPLTTLQAEAAQARLDSLLPVISEALDTHLRIITLALDILADKGAPTTAAVLSEVCLVRVGRHFAARVTEPLDEEDLARTIAERQLDRAEPMAAEEFFQRHHTAYLRLWNQEGKEAVRTYPPSRIGLGSDERPPTIGVPGERSWRLGTDRSVYDRYRLHFSDAATLRTHRPARRGRTIEDPERLAQLEVWRACQGYGLARPAHRVILESLARATLDETRSLAQARQVWQRWCAAPRPILEGPAGTRDDDLTAAVSAKVRLWAADQIAWSLRKTYGELSSMDDHIVRAIVQKVWMGLSAVEREEVGVVDSTLINGWVSTALDRGVPQVLHERARVLDTPPSARRRHRACELLTERPDLARILVNPGADDLARAAASTAYEAAARERWGTGWREQALTGAEAAAYVSSLTPLEEVG